MDKTTPIVKPLSQQQPHVVTRMQTRMQNRKLNATSQGRNVLSTTVPNSSGNKQQQLSADVVFKKPSTHAQRQSKENATDEDDADTNCEENEDIVNQTWNVIVERKESPQQPPRNCLNLSLAELAKKASRIKAPSHNWTIEVILSKMSPMLMQRQPVTTLTGDPKSSVIPEKELSCVLFRRRTLARSKFNELFDRTIGFKNKSFYTDIEGKRVNLLGAPESISNVKEVEILIDIVDSLTLTSDLVEIQPSNHLTLNRSSGM